MLDTRCYKCNCVNPIEMKYYAFGVYKCMVCGNIFDLSKYVYEVKIKRFYDIDNELHTKILKFDDKLNKEGKDIFEDDMIELDIFEYVPYGTYILHVYWQYYKCGGYEFPDECDVKTEILFIREIKQIHL